MAEPTNTVTEGTQAKDPPSEPSAADRLRALLDDPQPKDEGWQEQAGRVVARLSIEFPQEPDALQALRAASLITAAQLAGVKDAKKRALKLTRWSEERPPALRFVPREDEQLACIAMLSKLNVGWAKEYVAEAVADPRLPTSAVPELLRWARHLHSELSEFAPAFAQWLQGSASPERLLSMLKEAPRLFKAGANHRSRELAEAFAKVADGALAGLGSPAEAKQVSACLLALIALAQELATASPAILLETPTLATLVRLRPDDRAPVAAKALDQHLGALAAATLSLLQAEVKRYGAEAVGHWSPVMPLFRQAYPTWNKLLTENAQESPALQQWMRPTPAEAQGPQDSSYEHEAVFAQLLPAWQQFLSELPGASQTGALSQWIEDAARHANVEYLGTVGEVLDFDPLEHQLAESADSPPQRVRLVRSGVLVRRIDGSSRVLVRAVVVPS